LDSGNTYPKAVLLEYTVNRRTRIITALVGLGSLEGDRPQPGSASPVNKHLIQGEDYNTIIAAVSAANDEVYVDELERQILTWLEVNVEQYDGTVE